jgi:hypothetical protein
VWPCALLVMFAGGMHAPATQALQRDDSAALSACCAHVRHGSAVHCWQASIRYRLHCLLCRWVLRYVTTSTLYLFNLLIALSILVNLMGW